MQSPFHGASDVAREQAWLFGLVDVCRPNLVLDELGDLGAQVLGDEFFVKALNQALVCHAAQLTMRVRHDLDHARTRCLEVEVPLGDLDADRSEVVHGTAHNGQDLGVLRERVIPDEPITGLQA